MDMGQITDVGGMAIAFILALVIYEMLKQGVIYAKNGKNGNGNGKHDVNTMLLKEMNDKLGKILENDVNFKLYVSKGMGHLERIEQGLEKLDGKIDMCMHELRDEFDSVRTLR